ncbi:MAG: SRPBCC domain-containing protein [Candidatus Binataceae bacterium]
MAAEKRIAAESSETTLVVTRVFNAPRSLVFKAWTEPEHLMRWWGPRGYTTSVSEMDRRPGGAYRFRMQSSEGVVHWWHGVVREIAPPSRIVWTCFVDDSDGKPISGETLLTVTFEDQGARTKLTLHQAVFQTVTARDAHRGGWAGALDRLEEFLAQA